MPSHPVGAAPVGLSCNQSRAPVAGCAGAVCDGSVPLQRASLSGILDWAERLQGSVAALGGITDGADEPCGAPVAMGSREPPRGPRAGAAFVCG